MGNNRFSIKGWRSERGLTQRELANKVSVSTVAIRHWETGISVPNITQHRELANIFGCSEDAIFYPCESTNCKLEV